MNREMDVLYILQSRRSFIDAKILMSILRNHQNFLYNNYTINLRICNREKKYKMHEDFPIQNPLLHLQF
jgi:hypothetical protein